MARTSPLLRAGIGLLMLDAAIEMGFISTMVRWLNTGAAGSYLVTADDGSTFRLLPEPAHIITDQGHTANGAAGTAFVLVGLGSFLALWLRSLGSYQTNKFFRVVYKFWLYLTVPSTLLTLTALIFVNVVTATRAHQKIDMELAASLPAGQKYPQDSWTPQNWFAAVLALPLVEEGQVGVTQRLLRVMNGWRWNLIPLLVIEIAVVALAFADDRRVRRARATKAAKAEYTEYSPVSRAVV